MTDRRQMVRTGETNTKTIREYLTNKIIYCERVLKYNRNEIWSMDVGHNLISILNIYNFTSYVLNGHNMLLDTARTILILFWIIYLNIGLGKIVVVLREFSILKSIINS